MSSELGRLASHLVDGTLPEDAIAKKTCMKIAYVFTCLALRAKEDNDPISFHIAEKGFERSIVLSSIHTTWTLMILNSVARWDMSTFDKVAIFPITETIDVYAAYERLLSRPCPVCDYEFTSEINRERCIHSHMNKRKPAMRCGTYPIPALCDFWDASSAASRTAMLKDARQYVRGIPENASFSPIVTKFFELVKGTTTSMSGRDLMVAMDIISENTFMYNVTPTAVCIVCPTRGDYLASMAHEITRNVADAQATMACEMLLKEEPQKETKASVTTAKKKKKLVKKAKKQPRAAVVKEEKERVMVTESTDIVLDEQELVRNLQKQQELEDQYAKEAYPKYIDRLEKLIFSQSAVKSVAFWADLDFE